MLPLLFSSDGVNAIKGFMSRSRFLSECLSGESIAQAGSGGVLREADPEDLRQLLFRRGDRQEGLHGLRGVALPGIRLGDMVAELPATVSLHELNVADVLTGFQQHRIDERAVLFAVAADQKLDGFPGVLDGLEHLVRYETARVDQKGLDLINWILPQLIDGFTQVVVLGTGDRRYEDSFRYFEYAYKGSVCSNIMYDEGRAHNIYAGSDALLVPSLFEPCGLTQLIAMRYGTVPIVRETGGLKDTVAPYNQYENSGNGFTFDRYEVGLLLDAINRAKTLYFTERGRWDDMVRRDMAKDVSWDASAAQYRGLYLELKP